jgi:hypothetical protein
LFHNKQTEDTGLLLMVNIDGRCAMNREERQKKLHEKVEYYQEKRVEQLYKEIGEEYIEDLLDKENIVVLSVNDSRAIGDKFFEEDYPFDFRGSVARINWNLMDLKLDLKNAQDLSKFINENKFHNSMVYLIPKSSEYLIPYPPIIQTNIENVINSFEELSFQEKFIYCPDENYFIEIPFDAKVKIGWNKNNSHKKYNR